MGRIRVIEIIARMNVGGPAALLAELARGLDAQVFDVLIVTGECSPDEEDFLQTQAPDVVAKRIPQLGRKVRPWDDLVALVVLTRVIRAFQPDVVHTHTAKAGVLGRIAVKLAQSRARVVHTYHGHLLYGYFRPWLSRVVIQVERWLARVSDVLIAVGQRVRLELQAAGVGRGKDFRVIYPGVAALSAPSKGEARGTLGVAPDALVIGVVGRVTAIKRPDVALEIIEELQASSPNLCLVMAGSGDLAEAIAREVAERGLPVQMLGWRDDVEVVLAACDLVLLTSDNEGTPLSLIQAAMLGVPAVATGVGSVPEVVLDGETGLVVHGDPVEMVAAVRRMLDSAELRGAFGTAAQSFANERFSMPTYLRQHAVLYQELADRS